MIRRLEIRNYILINAMSIEFESGLNVITGETGAGKSIILGALGLLMGRRADSAVLKNPNEKCILELHLLLDKSFKKLFESEDLDFDEETIFRRQISVSGKSRAFINDTPVNLSVLKKVSLEILNIHQQFDTQKIADSDYQRYVLDIFADNADILEKYDEQYQNFLRINKDLKTANQKLEEAIREEEFNAFLLEEIDALQLTEDDLELEGRLNLIENAESIKLALGAFLDASTSEEQGSFQHAARNLHRTLERLDAKAEKLWSFKSQLNSILSDLQDLEYQAGTLLEEVDFDESELERLRQRLDECNRLMRKHQVESISALQEVRENIAKKVANIAEIRERIAILDLEQKDAHKSLLSIADKLSQRRRAAALEFSKQWILLLRELSMPNIQVSLEVNVVELNNFGQDMIAFHIAVNKGSELQLLSEVASGGEMSRMALAVDALISKKMDIRSLIFDEIDTGVSGEVAGKMGDRLLEISRYVQVVCITHSPQIASKGDHHWRVYKFDEEDETVTQMKKLNAEERIDELATMLSGYNKTDAAIANARDLLGMAK
jgi:DNA repair protein RecN (Recombination protein N)